MRAAVLVLALTFVCAASPAFAQARVLIAPSPVPLPDTQAAPDAVGHPGPAPRAQAEEPGAAQTSAPSGEPKQMETEDSGRFSFERVKDGVLRLDRVGGEVSFCQPDGTGWVCAAVPQDRPALEKEIERLRNEIGALKQEIASLKAPVEPPRPPQTVPPSSDDGKSGPTRIRVPTAEDVARARAFIAETWHRLVEIIDNWQKDVLRKT